MSSFDVCALVASSPSRAENIRRLVKVRKDAGLYPREIEFVVLSDPEGGRVGSGGASVLALAALREPLAAGKRVLLIHAGGESRRLPAYAPEGKLFAPVPVATSSLIPPVILDLQLSLFLKYPWQPGEVLIAAGDVVIDFDTEIVPEDRGTVYGFAMAKPLEIGAEHGVFRFSRNRNEVVAFYQKESVDFLRHNAALEGGRLCGVDLGIIGLSSEGVGTLMSLASCTMSSGRSFLAALQSATIGFDLYAEILTACLKGIDFETFHEQVSRHTKLLESDLHVVHGVFENIELRAVLARRGTFLHFGTLSEYPASSAELLASAIAPFYATEDTEIIPEIDGSVLSLNSRNVQIGRAAGSPSGYLEGCSNLRVDELGGANMLVGITDRAFEGLIPEGFCVDERSAEDVRFVLVYHRDDTWRMTHSVSDMRFCGKLLTDWLSERSCSGADFKIGNDLYDVPLFISNPDDSFVRGYWDLSVVDAPWVEKFKTSQRHSLAEISHKCSLVARERTRMDIRAKALREDLFSGRGWVSIPEWDFTQTISSEEIAAVAARFVESGDDLVRMYRSKLTGDVTNRQTRPGGSSASTNLSVDYVTAGTPHGRLARGVKSDQIVWARSPVRLDLAGGWTDTPPYTLREGGEVVNLAVNLNGQPPIQVFCRPTSETVIRIQSIDVGVREQIDSFETVEEYRIPTSPFALPKAALCLLGFTRERNPGRQLDKLLSEKGGGFELTLLSAVPKGSGLGTSSILAATILAALERFFGMNVTTSELVRQVLQIEQMLTTGGGWQDQIGGIVGGAKYIIAAPGMRPDPIVYQLDPYLFESPATRELFTLYYTGITRLAKNILQEVVDRVNTLEPAYLFTHRALKTLARSAREAISLRDLSTIGRIIDSSWSANKLIHASTTNDEVEDLLRRVSGLFTGMKLLGAGGGGYVLFLSESTDQAGRLRQRLSAIEHERARIVDMSLNGAGLQVSVS